MAIEVEIQGSGRFAGHKSNINSYSYTEQSTPHMIGDETGGVGDISITVGDNSNEAIVLYRDGMILTDPDYGTVSGRVDSLTSTDGVATLSAISRLGFINVTGKIEPGTVTLRDLFRSIFTAAGITADVAFSPAIPDTQVIMPGYEGDLWIFLKNACSAYQLEVTLINNIVYVQPIRQKILTIENVSTSGYSVFDSELAQSFNVAYYNYSDETDALAYPRGGWTLETPVYQVATNETVVFDIPVNAYLTSIVPPIPQDTVAKNYAGPLSVYAVSGNDGLPIPAAAWTDFGGNLTAELVQNGTVIQVTITGMDFESLSPFSIGLSDGATQYSTLRIVGDGVFYDRQLLNISTGLTPAITPTEVGVEIDNKFIDTLQDAYDAGIKTRRMYAMPRQTFTATGRSFVQKNYSTYEYFELDSDTLGLLDSDAVLGFVNPFLGVLLFQTFDEYNNSVEVGYLFSDFNDDLDGFTFDDFSLTVVEGTSQAFGFISGARVRYVDAFYRVRSSEISQNGMTINAEFDTIFQDFDDTFATYTFDQFNEVAVEIDFTDWGLIPLRTDPYVTYDYLFLDFGDLDFNALGF